MLRFLIFVLLIFAGYLLFKKIGKSLFGPTDKEESAAPADAELIQDPQCGTYFLKQRGVKGVVEGKVVHFCSEECYEKYLKRQIRDKPAAPEG